MAHFTSDWLFLQWADRNRVCWTASILPDAPCLPFDSLMNYLYPSVERQLVANQSSLVFDSGMNVSIGDCSLPPFGEVDVMDTIEWLRSQHLGMFLPPKVCTSESQHFLLTLSALMRAPFAWLEARHSRLPALAPTSRGTLACAVGRHL